MRKNSAERDMYAVLLRFAAGVAAWGTMYQLDRSLFTAKGKLMSMLSFLARCGLLYLFDSVLGQRIQKRTQKKQV